VEKQANFWDMASIAMGDEFASFNIVVEKWDSSLEQNWRPPRGPA
jgi:hypothetical protein